MSPGAVMFGVFVTLVLLVGLGLVAGGVAMLRRTSRIPDRRIPVEAYCVGRTFMAEPARVTLDYPVPGGWRRVTLIEGLPTSSVTGGVPKPGDRVVVWVDPDRPEDVRLSPWSSPGGLGGLMVLVIGVLACSFALLFVAVRVTGAPG